MELMRIAAYRFLGAVTMTFCIGVALFIPGVFMFTFFRPYVESDLGLQLLLLGTSVVSMLFWAGVRITSFGFRATEWVLARSLGLLQYGKIGCL